MKLLLDECIPQPLKKMFPNCEIETVASMQWSGKKDGELLALASVDFDIFITVDQNLRYQQNLQNFNIAIIILSAKTNKLKDLQPLADKANQYLSTIKSAEIIIIE